MSSAIFRSYVRDIEQAKIPEELFGPEEGSVPVLFRRYCAVVHPDRFATEPEAQRIAEGAFKRLGELHLQAEERIRLKIYGSSAPVPVAAPPFVPIELKVGRQVFLAERLRATGEVCDIYEGTLPPPPTGISEIALKIARHPSDNDLVENEAAILRALQEAATGHNHARYFPRLHSSFLIRGAAKKTRRVNILPLYPRHVSLAEVIQAYPGYIDFRDAAWMLKRALEALGFVHRQGFVHGAVLPEHLLVHPTEHGAKVIGWGASVRTSTCVRAISTDYRHWYPPEILKKLPATPASDIYLWARTALALVGHVAPPRRLVSFLEGCLLQSPTRRPRDAWLLRDELSELLEKLVGPPAYRAFTMPVAAP